MKIFVVDVDNTIADTRERMKCSLEDIDRGYVYEKTSKKFGGFREFLTEYELEELFRIFLSNKYLYLDEPESDSARVLAELVRRDVKIIYLTGRHDQRGDTMRPGTEEWLREHGFPHPKRPDVQLIMKPRRRMDDWEFKVRKLDSLTAKKPKLDGREVVGIGDMPDDVQAYSGAGIKPILLDWLGLFSRRQLNNSAHDVTVLKSWKQVESLLVSRYLVNT